MLRRLSVFPYALVPLNGKLPIGPTPISPEMASPETLPVNSSVSGIGLVIETFQATSSPLAVPSKISVELPSAPCAPRQRAARVLQAQRRVAVAHRRAHGDVPVSVHGHLLVSSRVS